MRLGWLAPHHHKRRNVLSNGAAHCGEAVLAYFGKLMHQGETAQYGMIMQLDVAGQRSAIRHNDMIANGTIVGDMGIGHKQVVIAYLGNALVLLGAAVQGGKFANGVPVADFQPGDFIGVFFVLRILAY